MHVFGWGTSQETSGQGKARPPPSLSTSMQSPTQILSGIINASIASIESQKDNNGVVRDAPKNSSTPRDDGDLSNGGGDSSDDSILGIAVC